MPTWIMLEAYSVVYCPVIPIFGTCGSWLTSEWITSVRRKNAPLLPPK
jgi:hypothetical protein